YSAKRGHEAGPTEFSVRPRPLDAAIQGDARRAGVSYRPAEEFAAGRPAGNAGGPAAESAERRRPTGAKMTRPLATGLALLAVVLSAGCQGRVKAPALSADDAAAAAMA